MTGEFVRQAEEASIPSSLDLPMVSSSMGPAARR